ncbi:hypothetical protein C0J52_10426 [Blattella germanica]|nr:hypothetical protein C0J52_10426 [Blattella germanica]
MLQTAVIAMLIATTIAAPGYESHYGPSLSYAHAPAVSISHAPTMKHQYFLQGFSKLNFQYASKSCNEQKFADWKSVVFFVALAATVHTSPIQIPQSHSQSSYGHSSYSHAPIVSYSHEPAVSYSHSPSISYSHTPTVSYSHTPSVSYSHTPQVSYSHVPQVSYSHAPVSVHHVPVEIHEEHHAPAHYEFKYGVHDTHTHDIKEQAERRHGDRVEGHYSLVEPDGTTRTVHYTADKHTGFHAQVSKHGHATHPTTHHRVHPVHAVQVVAAPVHSYGQSYAHATPSISYETSSHYAPSVSYETSGHSYGHSTPSISYGHSTPSISYGHSTPSISYGHSTPSVSYGGTYAHGYSSLGNYH